MSKVNLNVLNTASKEVEEVEFLKATIKGTTGAFLIKESYGGASVWIVDVDNVDFNNVDSVKTFLTEKGNTGESETFDSLEEAEDEFAEVF